MSRADFDYWTGILQTHSPEHPALARLGTTFVPRLPEEVEARRTAHVRAHPVAEMKDQDVAQRLNPTLADVLDWIDALTLRRHDGGRLKLLFEKETYAVSLNVNDAVQTQATGLEKRAIRQLGRQYLSGDIAGCMRQLRNARAGRLARIWLSLVDPS